MTDLISFLLLYAMFAATLCFLFAMLFVHDMRQWWMRGAVVAVGLVAVALPFFLAPKTLGFPSPWPPAGRYELLGWHIDEADGAFYVFVQPEGDAVPRHYRLPFDLAVALELQKVTAERSIYKEMTLEIADGPKHDEPLYDFTFERVFPDEPDE